MSRRPQCDVSGPGCRAPAGGAGLYPTARAECFVCGLAVCTNPACSRRMPYHRYGIRRVCAKCQEQLP